MNTPFWWDDFRTQFEAGNFEAAFKAGQTRQHYAVTDALISLTDEVLLPRLQKTCKIVASFDAFRKPRENEQIIIYGNYPNDPNNLLFSNPCFRHVKYFSQVKHDFTESHPAWNEVDQIFIINLDNRPDRYWETLRELARMAAPLDRTVRFSALTRNISSNSYLNGTAGCAASHLAVLELAIAKNYSSVLVLEDDFSFSDPTSQNLLDLQSFFKLKIPYDVCLLATSKYFHMEPVNELLALSFQECTTCAGYLLSFKGMRKLLPIWTSALADLIKTGICDTYACDRSWKVLQKDRQFYLFRRKLGFQRPNFSTTSQQIVFPLD